MKKSKNINYPKIFLIAIVIASFFMSIGYATINSVTLDLQGSSNAFAATGVFIYDANIDSTSPSNVLDSNISIMYGTMMQSRVVLNNNLSSTLTMNVTIYNKSNNDVYFDKVVYGDNFYDNQNIDYTLNGIAHGQKLGVNENVTFTVTFKYTDEYKATNPTSFTNILNSYLNFRFVNGYTITYNGFSNTTGLPEILLAEEQKNVTFSSSNGIPYNVNVTGCTSSYNSPTLSLSDASANIVVTRLFSVTYNNFTGNTSTLASEMTIDGGSITFNDTTSIPASVNVSGATGNYNSPTLTITNITDNIVITASYSGGQTHSTASTYDHNTLLPGTTTIFDNIPGKPKAVTDANGKVISFEYTDVGSGVVFDSNTAFDTGVDAFDDRGYTIHLKYKMDTSDNTGKMILSAVNNVKNKKYNGFALFVSASTQFYLNATETGTNIANNNTVFGSRLCDGWRTTSGEKEYTFDMTFSPSPSKDITVSQTPVSAGSTSYSSSTNQLSYYPDTIEDISISIGGGGVLSGRNIASMTVLEFSIVKN